MKCQPCWERKKIDQAAVKDVAGTPMCKKCWGGKDLTFGMSKAGRMRCPESVALRIVNEFLPYANKKFCGCGTRTEKGKTLCDPCRQFRANVTAAKYLLRKWEETREHRQLVDAARLIETNRITPEDFMRS
jgi:hypothetical protein